MVDLFSKHRDGSESSETKLPEIVHPIGAVKG